MTSTLTNIFRPNATISEKSYLSLTFGWFLGILALWWLVVPIMTKLIPTPPEVLQTAGVLWSQGAIIQIKDGHLHSGPLITSIFLSLSSIAVALSLGLFLSYLSTIPFFKRPVQAIGSMRVLSLTGITFIFTLATPNGYYLKLSVMVFAIVVFLVNNMLQVIDDIPESKFDYARATGLSQWLIMREVVIRGTLAQAFDSLRMNAAMAWMMLTLVEGLSQSGGGIGVLLIQLARQENFAAIFVIQFMIYFVGMGQDSLITHTKQLVCPYTKGH